MAERGTGLSSRVSTAAATSTSNNKHVPAGLWGRTIRRALLSPRAGFRKVLDLDRARPGGRGRALMVSLPAGLGGAFLLLVFLKVRGLTGFRAVAPEDFRWGVFAAALGVGAVAGVVAHFLFGTLGGPLSGRLGRRVSSRGLRMIWGVAALPGAVAFVLLVALDVLIAGREAYSAIEGDTVATGWLAGSLALALGLGGWSLYLFVQGLCVAAEIRPARSIMMLVLAGACLLVAAPIAFLLVIGVVTLVGLVVDVVRAVAK